MKETECQQLLIDAVQEVEGCGLKFNNRFVVGIPDLLLKMPGHVPMIIEAKLHKFSAKTIERGYVIEDIGCTKRQKDELRDWHRAGMLTGVASFVMETDGDVRSLRLALYDYDHMVRHNWSGVTRGHKPLGEKAERMTNIRELLIGFANG